MQTTLTNTLTATVVMDGCKLDVAIDIRVSGQMHEKPPVSVLAHDHANAYAIYGEIAGHIEQAVAPWAVPQE